MRRNVWIDIFKKMSKEYLQMINVQFSVRVSLKIANFQSIIIHHGKKKLLNSVRIAIAIP